MSRRDRDAAADPHLAVRPFLAARPGELEPGQARQLTEHLSRCQGCAAEAAGFHRITIGLAAMRELELEPPVGLLDTLVAISERRRSVLLVRASRGLAPGGRVIQDPRVVAAAAGAGGAIVATAVVAGVLRSRRRDTARGRLRALALPAPDAGRGGFARLLRRPDRPALPVPALGTASARAR